MCIKRVVNHSLRFVPEYVLKGRISLPDYWFIIFISNFYGRL